MSPELSQHLFLLFEVHLCFIGVINFPSRAVSNHKVAFDKRELRIQICSNVNLLTEDQCCVSPFYKDYATKLVLYKSIT